MYRLCKSHLIRWNFEKQECQPKLFASVPEAITLVKNVRGMCRARGFRLTKFVSNRWQTEISSTHERETFDQMRNVVIMEFNIWPIWTCSTNHARGEKDNPKFVPSKFGLRWTNSRKYSKEMGSTEI